MLPSVNSFIYNPSKLNYGPAQRDRYSDSLRGGRSGDRIPLEERYSALFQTGPEAQPASFTIGTGFISHE